ncbi:hypothetical protein SSBR45G_41870 [Bradyrhizobium sp. SSBR45G]|uniref:hypothetical protein n=1 Tax=unclassified Bradyrhizobium TaxID=2631580 RepID=UPI002342AAA8|nr:MULTISPECIES: hypothetical protein [unclassified Bradyrhizobium]GLH79278.1 hypothetical protein SSBR45G_41870 [Bradyrhizobium sp. SSBR45G]GLH86786.1 hypothetical protein SSBR45R_42460 [Bradyrhizobium sp. SSBR45R]
MARTPRAPWKKANPRKRAGKASTHLSPAEKAKAKARARRAGRRYPNLVDNMRVAADKAAKTKTSGRRRAAKSTIPRKQKRVSARKSKAKTKSTRNSSS